VTHRKLLKTHLICFFFSAFVAYSGVTCAPGSVNVDDQVCCEYLVAKVIRAFTKCVDENFNETFNFVVTEN